ncbi:hypothetical protein IC216_19515 [Clostridioides sp. ES-S-0145-01]|uniref:YceG family protein n=1 Tax=Clostridioides sp. ES-S-0145-01 TaxID=2770784 RepID=UPI001D10FC5D|nr:hypothetical protein [Clostridioides sp. ES-S-0145-01]
MNNTIDKVLEKILSSQIDRGNYTPAIGYLSYFNIFIGVDNEDLYNQEIFKFNKKIENRSDVIIFKEGIPNFDNNEKLTNFKSVLTENVSYIKELDIELINNESINYKVKKSIDEIYNISFDKDKILNILIWIKEYVGKVVIDKFEPPKIIYYGKPNKIEYSLLLILFLAGFDILCLSPSEEFDIGYLRNYKKDVSIDYFECSKEKISFDERVYMGSKIESISIDKKYTIAAETSERIGKELLDEAGFIKPWQLKNKKIKNILISTTLEEIPIYWDELVSFRHGFSYDEETVNIPVIFAKISGVYSEKDLYYNFIRKLKQSEFTYFINYKGNDLILCNEFTENELNLSYTISNNRINKSEILRENKYSISSLDLDMQKMILDKIEELMEGNLFITGLSDEDKVKGLNAVLNMNEKLIRLLNAFDYSRINPKLVVFIGKNYNISREICFLLLLLSKIGVDIIILSPGGESNIENIIIKNLIDFHRLDKMEYDIDISSIKDELNKENYISFFKNRKISSKLILAVCFVLIIAIFGVTKLLKNGNPVSATQTVTYKNENSNQDVSGNSEIVTPFKASDIQVIVDFKEKTEEGYIYKAKITNNSKTPLKDMLITVSFDDGEDEGFLDCYGTTMPGKSQSAETLSNVKADTIDLIDTYVIWTDDKGRKINTYVDFQQGTTESSINVD